MGRVYRARDRRLGRAVAIKVIGSEHGENPQALARLRREAETASSLNHPAIVTIYDISEAPESGLFIAMELIEGANLRDWLRQDHSRREKLDVLLQVAGGVAAAHARGLVHRDIKPENIMVTPVGLAKVVDFGLAKLVAEVPPDAQTDAMITARGGVVGTLAYMSPEQLRGESLDERSDIFSFGCVLYEAFAGKPPFGWGSTETIGRILHSRPDPLPRGVDASIAAAIERCLQKQPAARYGSIDRVAADLRAPPESRPQGRRWTLGALTAVVVGVIVAIAIERRPAAVSTLPAQKSLAVLPFRTVGNAEAYVADGIGDALTTDLAKQSNLTVIARNSSQRFKEDTDVRRIGDELRARYLLLGTVQRLANNVRVDARLIDATTNTHVWAEHYERPLSEIFSAEQAIVRGVTAAFTPQAAAPRALPQPSDPRVADLYLRARFFAEDPVWPTQDRSIPLLEEVVQLDPNFLPARITLAAQYQRRAFQPDPDRTWEQKSFVELQKILAVDPSSAAAYTIRGNLRWTRAHGFPHEESLADLDHAVQLDPNFVSAYDSRGSILIHVGLLDEALADFLRALRLDPFSDFAAYRITRIHLYQQKCAQAASELKRRWPNDFQLPVALDCAGASDEALATLQRLHPDPSGGAESDVAASTAVLFAHHGKRREAKEAIRNAIARDKGGSHYHHAMYYIAAAYAQLRDPDNALQWLERTSREGMPCYPLFASDPLLDPVRSDPRIQAFLDASHREWEERRRNRRHA